MRRLRDDLVVDAVERVEPLVGRGLAGAGERDQHALGDVLLGEADLAGLAAVDVDLHGGVGDLLVDVDVDRAGDGGDLLHELLGELDSCSCRGRRPAGRSARAGRSRGSGW